MKTIIVGHGKFGTAYKESIQMLRKVPSDFIFIDFQEGMSEEDLHKKLLDYMNKNEKILFFTDLLGGTPYKVSIQIIIEESDIEGQVVTGCNISSLIETSFNTYDSIYEYAKELVEISRRYTIVWDESELENVTSNFDDGI